MERHQPRSREDAYAGTDHGRNGRRDRESPTPHQGRRRSGNSRGTKHKIPRIALICNGPIFGLLGYNADAEAGMEILEGTFIPPKGTDPATIIILNKIARIWKLMGDGEVSIIIAKEDFQHYWKRVKERTALSYSGRHFGHYKSAT